jgi:hypothetical protein
VGPGRAPGTGPAMSRRRLLGTAGAGAAALAGGALVGGGVLGSAEPAQAVNGFVKWGACVSPDSRSNWATQINIFRRMKPNTVRIPMFWSNSTTRRFNDSQLNDLLNSGISEVIIQSAEDADSTQVNNELNQVTPYVAAHPGRLFVFEIGNEPDIFGQNGGDPWLARWKRLTAIRDNKWRLAQYSNLKFAINMPAGKDPTTDPGFPWSSGNYFSIFTGDAGDGLGGMFFGPNRPEILTAHCYSPDYLVRRSGERNPWKMLDYIKGWNDIAAGRGDQRRSVKVTEAGINNGSLTDRGYRYRSFGWALRSDTTGYNVDSVCFYGLPISALSYSITGTEADQLGTHG